MYRVIEALKQPTTAMEMDNQEENETMSHDDQAEIVSSEGLGENVASEVVGELLGAGVPAPVRRNFFKAFSRMCSALIDIPVASWEGRAQERRALTEERVRLIHTTGVQISEQMRVDPEYARRAVTQFGNKVLREQVNLDTIIEKSKEHLKQSGESADQATSEAEIDDDWLEHFDTEARKKSTTEMQEYFAKVLTGEIKKPNSFSIKTIRILGTMDKSPATLFQRFCSMCIVQSDLSSDRVPLDARVVSLAGNASSNALAKYGLPFDSLNVLHEYGLIISDYNSRIDCQQCCPQPLPINEAILDQSRPQYLVVPFFYRRRPWMLLPMSNTQRKKGVSLNGVALTRSGRELMSIVELKSADQYTLDLIEFFKKRQLIMTEADKPQPHIWQHLGHQ